MSGVNYHAWTHRPKSKGGTDPLVNSWEWAYCSRSSSTTITTGVETVITMTEHAIDATATALVIDTATEPLKVVKTGIVFISLQAEWSGSGFTDTRLAMISQAGGGSMINIFSSYPMRATNQDPYYAGHSATFGPAFVEANASSNVRFGLKVRQNTGSNATFVSCALGILWMPANPPLDTYNASFFSDHVVSF